MELDQVAKLKRYFFLGKLIPVYSPRKEDALIEDFDVIKELLATVDGGCFLTLVKGHTQREANQLPRRNEVWFAYAVYLSVCERPEDRKKVYQAFPELATSAEDMFTVVHYSNLIQQKKGAKGHSRTIRKALALWYKSKSEADLTEMLAKNRGMYGLTHKGLIQFGHISLEKVGLAGLESALFKSSAKALADAGNPDGPKCQDVQNQEKLMKMYELKSCKDPVQARELIESNKFGLDTVPNSLLHKAEVWQALVPQLSYRQLLNSLFSLIDMKLINHRGLSEQLVKALGEQSSLSAAKISPILMLIHAKRLHTKKRYSEKKKDTYHTEKEKRMNIKENPLVSIAVLKMFRASFDHLKPQTGLKFFIAINLQTNYGEKRVIKQNQLTCSEAAITLALTYFRSESKVDVYTYTAIKTVLEKLNWTPDISYDKALEICSNKQSAKNIQRIFTPIWEATKKPSDYDVFLIIVPSGARGNPSFKPDKLIQNINVYRDSMNKRARVIVVNLRRLTPSLIHDQSKIVDNGILEICGFGENTLNIINAFATHAFS